MSMSISISEKKQGKKCRASSQPSSGSGGFAPKAPIPLLLRRNRVSNLGALKPFDSVSLPVSHDILQFL